MTDGPRPRPGVSSRGPQPDPVRRPAPGVTDLRERLLSGFGSPEGVVFAGAGAGYQDTDPAGSGQHWRKTTPTGNTGWEEVGTGVGGGGPSTLEYFTALGDVAPLDTGPIDSDQVYWTFPNQEHQSGGFSRVPISGIAGGEGITIPSAGFWIAHLAGQVQPTFDLTFSGLPPIDSYDHSTYLVTPSGTPINVTGVLEAGDLGDNPSLHPYVLIPFYVDPADVGQVAYFRTGFVALGSGGSSQTLIDALSGDGMRFALYKIAGGVGGGGGSSSGMSVTLTHPAAITSVGGDNYVPLSTIEHDSSSGALWDIANPDRLLAPSAGNYLLTANWDWYPITFGAGEAFSATLDKNGAGTAAGFPGWDFSSNVGGPGGNTGFSTLVSMAAGDYLRVDLIDSAGGGHQIQHLRVGWALMP